MEGRSSGQKLVRDIHTVYGMIWVTMVIYLNIVMDITIIILWNMNPSSRFYNYGLWGMYQIDR